MLSQKSIPVRSQWGTYGFDGQIEDHPKQAVAQINKLHISESPFLTKQAIYIEIVATTIVRFLLLLA